MNKMIINNFLSITHAEIEIRKITLFIGPQAAGKSVIVKLYYFFNLLNEILMQEVRSSIETRTLKERVKDSMYRRFCEIFPVYTWRYKGFEITYETKESSVVIRHRARSSALEIELGERYETCIEKCIACLSRYINASPDLQNKYLKSRLNNNLMDQYTILLGFTNSAMWNCNPENYIANDFQTPVFIPAGREIFAAIRDNPYSSFSQSAVEDYFLGQFGYLYESQRKFTISSRMFEERIPVLNELYIYDADKQLSYLKKNKVGKIQLNHASSGEQEFLPFFMTMKIVGDRQIIVEEPETHLFPTAQLEVVRMLTENIESTIEDRKNLLVTTHSPYVLSAFNNLLYAGAVAAEKAGNAASMKKLERIVPERYRISPGNLSAYMIKDGTAQQLVQRDTGLILAEAIDDASDMLAMEFDRIQEL